MNRRKLLAVIATGGTLGVAGCLGGGDDSSDNGNSTDSGEDPNGDGNGTADGSGDGNADGNGNGDPQSGGPEASFSADPSNPEVGQSVTLDAGGSTGDIAEYRWDLTGDGETDNTGETVTHTFESPGEVEVTLEVEDGAGGTDTATETVAVGEPEELDVAVEALVTLAEEFEQMKSGLTEQVLVLGRVQQLQEQATTAEEALDDAEAAGASDEAVAAGRNVLAFQRDLIEGYDLEVLARDAYIAALDAVGNAIESGADFDTIESELDQFGEGDDRIDERITLQESLELPESTDVLGAAKLTYGQSATDYVRHDVEDLERITATSQGYQRFLEGTVEMFRGVDHAENDQWADAVTSFNDALGIVEGINQDLFPSNTNIPDSSVILTFWKVGLVTSEVLATQTETLSMLVDAAENEDASALDQTLQDWIDETGIEI